MKLFDNKKIIIFLSICSIFISGLNAKDFNWSSYKKTLPSSIIDNNRLTNSELTKKQIKKQYDVEVERRTLEEIKRDQNTKNLCISMLYRNPQTYGVYTKNTTSTFGISIVGKFDLMPIGKKFFNTYAHVDVFEDSIFMGLSRRIQAENRQGLFSDVGGGLFFQTKETVRKRDMYIYGMVDIGYNFEDWNIKVGVNIPSDAFNNGFLNSTEYKISLGWRF